MHSISSLIYHFIKSFLVLSLRIFCFLRAISRQRFLYLLHSILILTKTGVYDTGKLKMCRKICKPEATSSTFSSAKLRIAAVSSGLFLKLKLLDGNVLQCFSALACIPLNSCIIVSVCSYLSN